jgi:hypothetical protein
MGTYTFSDFENMDWDGEEKWLKIEVDFDNGSGIVFSWTGQHSNAHGWMFTIIE